MLRALPLLPISLLLAASLSAATPQTTDHTDAAAWRVFNREVTHTADAVHLDARRGDGILWLKDVTFTDGTLEFDVRGRNAPGQSFVGLAFHGTDDETFEAVYFRPFNFHNAARKSHSVQYISMPEHDWKQLRETRPGAFEAALPTPPDPDAWFHVRLVLAGDTVTAFLNNDSAPVLSVKRLAAQTTGQLGFWVGFGSEGWFRHLSLTPAN